MRLDLSRKEKIERLRALPADAALAVKGLDDRQLDTTYRAGGWTVRQVIHHVADSHLNLYVRVRKLLTEDAPAMSLYDQDGWAALPDATSAPVELSLALLGALHSRLVHVLEHVEPRSWSRVGVHPEAGEMTLDQIVDLIAWHGDHHVAQVVACRAENGW